MTATDEYLKEMNMFGSQNEVEQVVRAAVQKKDLPQDFLYPLEDLEKWQRAIRDRLQNIDDMPGGQVLSLQAKLEKIEEQIKLHHLRDEAVERFTAPLD